MFACKKALWESGEGWFNGHGLYQHHDKAYHKKSPEQKMSGFYLAYFYSEILHRSKIISHKP